MGFGLYNWFNKFNRIVLEKQTIEGESPVYERKVKVSGIQSSTRHEKSRMNKRGPSRKAKYYLVTDSELVPWGKGEKNPGRGVK